MAERLGAIYGSNLWLEDADKIAASLPELGELAGKSVLVTGAGGMICSAVIDVLLRYNESHSESIGIIAAGRSPARISERFGKFCDKDYFRFVQYDASRPEPMAVHADYIIHGAGNAHPAAMSAEPVETMQSNFLGINTFLNSAIDVGGGGGIKRLLYLSSSEVYGKRSADNSQPFSENDYGYVDLLSPRSCYPISKRAAETLCACYAEEYGVDSVIVRPGHIYGPTARTDDSKVSSAFAYLAAKGEDIVMKTEGVQLRSWCYCLDCASAILKVLLRGGRANAYNVPGEILTIRQMTELLAEFGGVKVLREGASQSELKAFNPMNNSSVDGRKLEALGWRSLFDARTGLEHTVEILRSML